MSGQLPRSELARWQLGRAKLHGDYADIAHSESLAALRTRIWPRLGNYGLAELDASAIRLSVPRRLTQELSRIVYEWSSPPFAGIRYTSRLGDDVENWAVFERDDAGFEVVDVQGSTSEDDSEFARALDTLAISLV